jgi:hypothetical protein
VKCGWQEFLPAIHYKISMLPQSGPGIKGVCILNRYWREANKSNLLDVRAIQTLIFVGIILGF